MISQMSTLKSGSQKGPQDTKDNGMILESGYADLFERRGQRARDTGNVGPEYGKGRQQTLLRENIILNQA